MFDYKYYYSILPILNIILKYNIYKYTHRFTLMLTNTHDGNFYSFYDMFSI